MSLITTHVLDTSLGRPAAGVPVSLERADGTVLATSATGADGRVADLGPDALPAGRYRLVFDAATYFAATGRRGLYPRVSIDVELSDPDPSASAAHFHLPLLLGPFAYSTYRGS